MSTSSDLTDKGLPSPSAASLLKASGVALLIAAIVLTIFVLPAEYGMDPTGLGEQLGLTTMNDPEADSMASAPATVDEEAPAAVEPVSVLDALWKRDGAFRADEMTLTLEPNEGGEIKALMAVGDRMMFSWSAAGGVVSFDMHGEALNAPQDEFTSYWKGRGEAQGHGAFEAPFAGTHGWYWRNRGTAPVTVRVRTSGYYEKLFKP
jgi:hypothetical protein